MKIAILVVAACFVAVVELQAHAEAEEDVDVSAVRLVRRVRRTYNYIYSITL